MPLVEICLRLIVTSPLNCMRPVNLLSSHKKVNEMRIRESLTSESLMRKVTFGSLSKSSHRWLRAVSAGVKASQPGHEHWDFTIVSMWHLTHCVTVFFTLSLFKPDGLQFSILTLRSCAAFMKRETDFYWLPVPGVEVWSEVHISAALTDDSGAAPCHTTVVALFEFFCFWLTIIPF